MPTPELTWLAPREDWRTALSAIPAQADADTWAQLSALAQSRLDMLGTAQLDRKLLTLFPDAPAGLQTRPVRLAVLGSSTVDHLFAGTRVACLRRGLWTTLYKTDYGQYAQELHDPASALRAWRPDTVLFALDAQHLLGGYTVGETQADTEARLARVTASLVQNWRIAREQLGCAVIQQTLLPVFPRLFGGNEHRLSSSPAALLERLNERLRQLAEEEGVALLALDHWVAQDGLAAWHDPVLWHRAKQEIHLAAAPMYGELVARILAAQQGRSAKCLVLDLDNTLWGGVIGDDGLQGIVLGQGSALGEAFVAFQRYARDLSRRGVILAVCSKNDEANALLPFRQHPDMLLRREDIACFAASWTDKATALRDIARALNIGLDALVFADDNPFERNIVRRELPMVAVPELPADPAYYADTLARAGYFEALTATSDDLARTRQYQENAQREAAREQATDMNGYLASLNMELRWSPFTRTDQARVHQLINKTNQFNLTTRRYSAEEVAALVGAPDALTLQLRLSDQFGDNGIVSVIIGRLLDGGTVDLDTWLMSCRVLGRQVEAAALNLLVREAQRLGATRLLGRYRPSDKNAMVAGHYTRLGFTPLPGKDGDTALFELELAGYTPKTTFIHTAEMTHV
jgi:FkbH-like protein